MKNIILSGQNLTAVNNCITILSKSRTALTTAALDETQVVFFTFYFLSGKGIDVFCNTLKGILLKAKERLACL